MVALDTEWPCSDTATASLLLSECCDERQGVGRTLCHKYHVATVQYGSHILAICRICVLLRGALEL